MSNVLNELSKLGVDTDEALRRFMNNAALYERMLGKFVESVGKLNVMSCFESGDIENALTNAHTLKGVTGNLSLTPLYRAYTDIVALIREGKTTEAKKLLEDILPTQDKILGVIKGENG